LDPNDLFEKLKDTGKLAGKSLTGGHFTDKEKFGFLKTEYDVKSRERRQISLEDFAGKSTTSYSAPYLDDDLSEREEEDIYTHYIEQMRKAKLEAAQEKPSDQDLSEHERQARETLNKIENDLFPDMPRFEGFFKSQAEGSHPFEEDQYRFNDKNATSTEQ